ncbi:MAG: 16S rRNA (cytosine(1402)-N(4))-methyltransferase [Candidatus Omnitrophica bacterium CG07_land_8_20_14_0_80_42_15]|uniref:Ribosomal RNA small subunit methyltransferase H n=1 Tax=Candidatus Aquitaenariimonas noxiae TaxID=1974741 RepID=A0A2J0L0J5_9BACT|nr:MAG: 16S rRNA (cytosine(1402)-N(4))-methyltransferase [Candidatus Omnitrophica bacterium CG07_land_8_20_14_0_80_42_15]
MDLHTPVMAGEVIENLKLKPGNIVVDCTVGGGGHSAKILEKIVPGGMLIGIDQDDESLKAASQRLSPYQGSYKLVQDNFRNLNSIFENINVDKVDSALFDLGVASMHFDTPYRGFSIRNEGPLDMRMDRRQTLTAHRIVNTFSYEKLAQILYEYGEERKSRRIASFIVEVRKKKPIDTTAELAKLIEKAYYGKGYLSHRIHPATRTFLALRLAVNDELEALKEGLVAAIGHLRGGAVIAVISFHSLEDRIVKHMFKEYAKEGKLKIITKSPLRPSRVEIIENPRARSAKLRVGERQAF